MTTHLPHGAWRADAESSANGDLKPAPALAVRKEAMTSPSLPKFEIPWDPHKALPIVEVERRYIEFVLGELGGNKTHAAEALGIGRTTLYRKLGLRKDGQRRG